MAITSELIGKLGGGTEIESWDVSVQVPISKTGVIDTVNIASGETKLLVLLGEFSRPINSIDSSYIQIGGGEKISPYSGSKIMSAAQVITSTADIILNNSSLNTQNFSGTVYLFDFPS